MTVLTMAMMLAWQDAPRVHEDPTPRTGPVPRPVAVVPAPVHQPRPPRGLTAHVEPPVMTTVPVRSPPPRVMAPPAPPAPPLPQPRPGPLPAGAQALTPRGSPSSWVTGDDYPMAMLRAHATGTSAFDLDVDATGRVFDCRITASSGWPALDATACTLMRRRARFNPARDAAGLAIPATWSNRFRWDVPDTPAAFGSWARVVRFVVDKDGGVQSCTVTNFGAVPPRAMNPCSTDSWRMKALHGPGSGLVTVNWAEIHRAEGMPMPAGFVAPSGRRVTLRTIAFTVQPSGSIGTCSVAANEGLNPLPSDYSVYDCHTGLRYLVPPEMQRQPARSASFTVEVTTNGEAPVTAALKRRGDE